MPGGIDNRRYSPCSSLVVVRLIPFPASVAVTVAPATTAPVESVILPLISAVAPPAWAKASAGSATQISARKRIRAGMCLIYPPKVLGAHAARAHALLDD